MAATESSKETTVSEAGDTRTMEGPTRSGAGSTSNEVLEVSALPETSSIQTTSA